MDETRLVRFIHLAGWNVMRDKLIILFGCLLAVSMWLVWPRQPVALAPPIAVVTPVKPAPASIPVTPLVAAVAPAPAEDLPALIRARLQAWDDDDNPALRAARLQELDALLAHSDVFAVLQTLPSNLMGYAFATPTVQQKLIADPQAALDWMGAHTNAQSQLLTLLHDWGQTNREVMQQYLADLPAGDWRQKVLFTAANEALSADPAASINIAVQTEPGPQQSAWLDMAVKQWAGNDPNAACQWVSQVKDSALRDQLIGSLAIGAANTDPAQAAGFALEALPPGTALNHSLSDIVWTWALQDPAGAGAWVSKSSQGEWQPAALANLMSVWGNHDANAATTWIEGLPPGDFQTQAARELLFTLHGQTP
jgi:hypothetical protein